MPDAAEQRALTRARVPLAAMIAESVDLRVEQLQMRGPCPLHPDSSRGLYVGREGYFHCFSCGAGGDVVDWTMRVKGVDEAAAIHMLLGSQPPAAD